MNQGYEITAMSLLYKIYLQTILKLRDISFLSSRENRRLASVNNCRKKPVAFAMCSLCDEHHALPGHED